MSKLGSQIMVLAAGYLSWATLLNVTGKALEYVREQTERAKQSQDSLVDSRRRLAQVATGEADLAAMLERADQAAIKFGVDRQKAYQVMFQARSEDFEQDFEVVLRNATVVNPEAAAGVAGQVPGLFRQTQQITPEQAISGTLAAAQQSRLTFEGIAQALPQAAEGVAQARGTFEETAAALGVLAGRFKSGETASERIKLFAAKLAQDSTTAGRGLIGGFDALVAAGKDGQDKFLGQSVELRAAFTILGEEMPRIREQASRLRDEMARTAAGQESMVARQRRIAEADPAEQARLARVRAVIEEERATERQFAQQANLRQAAHASEMSRLKERGVVAAAQAPASAIGGFIGGVAELFGADKYAAAVEAASVRVIGEISSGQVKGYEDLNRRIAEPLRVREAERPGAVQPAPPPAAVPPAPPPTVSPATAAAAMPIVPIASLPNVAEEERWLEEMVGVEDDLRKLQLAAAQKRVSDMTAEEERWQEEIAGVEDDLRKRHLAEIAKQEALQQSIDETTRRLQEEIAVRGMNADEVERWKLEQRGAAADQLAQIKQLQDQAAAGRNQPKESVAGTFSGWRLASQFGGIEPIAKEQLAETKRQSRTFLQLLSEFTRLQQKKLVWVG